MKTKILMVMMVLGALAMLGLAGCSGGTVEAQSSPQPVSVNVNSQQGIWVTGQGIVSVTPDIATLSLGVSAQSTKVVDAQSQAADAMSQVISTLTSSGIDKKDIATQNYSINQLTRYDNNTGQSTVTGYQVSNIASVTIRAIDKVGTIIDAVTAAAGDLIRVNGISFSVDKPAQFNDQARSLAMADAKAKAQQLATL
ncbi:MAG TPA: SIMPL domain-containing protein, partial [Dehalococcoidales bacterium]